VSFALGEHAKDFCYDELVLLGTKESKEQIKNERKTMEKSKDELAQIFSEEVGEKVLYNDVEPIELDVDDEVN
jgi:hypothetical protein